MRLRTHDIHSNALCGLLNLSISIGAAVAEG
jgi:hypothetical protein